MTVVAAACAVVVLGTGTQQLIVVGWRTFISRPERLEAPDLAQGQPGQVTGAPPSKLLETRRERGRRSSASPIQPVAGLSRARLGDRAERDPAVPRLVAAVEIRGAVEPDVAQRCRCEAR
jgi:hypothetical protein